MTFLPSGWTTRRVVAELPFIPATSNWIKLLLSLLAEPFMFLSSLYIIAETVIPGIEAWSPFFAGTTKIIMSIAPEVVLPGCFRQAQNAWRDGETHKAQMLYALCVLFGALTLVTFASFLWHFAESIGNLILFVRCSAGIGYTIILNISQDDHEQQGIVALQPATPVTVQPVQPAVQPLVQPAIAPPIAPTTPTTTIQVIQQNNAQPVAPTPMMVPLTVPFAAQEVRSEREVAVHDEEPAPAAHSVIAQLAHDVIAQLRTAQTEPSLPVVEAEANDANDVQQRIFKYLNEYSVDGHQVTLAEIEAVCHVAKNTASRYRKAWREAQEAMVQQ